MLVRIILEEQGYSIATAGTVADVRTVAKAWLPHLVLLNIDLEGRGDGLGLLPELVDQGIRVVIFSAYSAVYARRTWRLPEVPYIEQPFTIEELVESVARFCPQYRDDGC